MRGKRNPQFQEKKKYFFKAFQSILWVGKTGDIAGYRIFGDECFAAPCDDLSRSWLLRNSFVTGCCDLV